MKRIVIDYSNIDIDEEVMERNSLVTSPAHGSNAYFFSNHNKMLFSDDEQQIILGVAIEANKDIFRNANEIVPEDHYVSFTPQTIVKIRNAFHKSENVKKINFEHSGGDSSELVLVQSYIVGGKTNPKLPLIFNQKVNDGSWILGYHVPDKDAYNRIKKSGYGGFSVEVAPYLHLENFKINSMKKNVKKNPQSFWSAYFGAPKKVVQKFEATTVDGEKIVYEGDFTEGTVLNIEDADGNLTPLASVATVINVDGVDYAVETDENGAITSISEIEVPENSDSFSADFAKEVRNQFAVRDAQITKLVQSLDAAQRTISEFSSKFSDLENKINKLSLNGKFSAENVKSLLTK